MADEGFKRKLAAILISYVCNLDKMIAPPNTKRAGSSR